MTNYEFSNNWIDRFKDGDLSPSEREIFLRELERNPELMKEFKLDEKIEEFFSDAELFDLMRKIHKIRHCRGRRKGFLLLLAAASLLSLIIVGLICFSIRDCKPGLCRKKSDLSRERQQVDPVHHQIPGIRKRSRDSHHDRFPGISGNMGLSVPFEPASIFPADLFARLTPVSPQSFQSPPAHPAEAVPPRKLPWQGVSQDNSARTQRSWLQNFPYH